MDWISFKQEWKDNYSQTYNIVLKGMIHTKWIDLLQFLNSREYLIKYETSEDGVIADVTAKEIVDYFNIDREFWPTIVLEVEGFRLDGFIKGADHLELWFNDRNQTELNEEMYDVVLRFIKELSSAIKGEVSFENEDALTESLILKADHGVIK